MADKVLRKPEWLKIDFRNSEKMTYVNNLLESSSLNTVCKSANCPNRMECYSKRTATFMILGNVCSRTCQFCNVEGGTPEHIDSDEPRRVAEMVKKLALRHTVITSVTRDDLDDGGSDHFYRTIQAIKELNPDTVVEALIPDFQGDAKALQHVLNSGVDILNHNVETVSRLYDDVRPQAEYKRSLELLQRVKEFSKGIYSKSGLMVGLGETYDEVIALLNDLREVSCDFLTIGQYLQPSRKHYPVKEYVHPDIFEKYKEEALKLGFQFVASGPLVRSSYHAEEFYNLFIEKRGE